MVVLALFAAATVWGASDIYVAPGGDDSGPGTKEQPFATLERVRDAVRELSPAQRTAGGGVTVWLRGGVYHLERTFELDSRDSGAAGRPVVYRSFPGEAAVLSGGHELPVEAFRPVADPAVLGRLPQEARAKVLRVDLTALGITQFGEMKPRGFGHPYTNPGLELFFDDEPMQLARWPNEGMVPIGKVLDAGSVPRDGDFSGRGGTFTYDFDRPARWVQADDVWLSGLFAYGFADDTMKVKSLDTAARTITLSQPHVYGLKSGQPFHGYHALNLLEEIDRPGEWYLDRRHGMLYFWPPLTLEVSRGIGVYIESGTGNRVAGCTLRNLGVVGVCIGQGVRAAPDGLQGWQMDLRAERGEPYEVQPVSRELGDYAHGIYGDTVWNRQAGTDHGVVGCDIYNTGAGGVSLGGGDRRTLTRAGNFVLNCHIHHYSRLDRSYRCAVNMDGVGNKVSHCLIHDAPQGAVLLHGNDHVIELCEIHDACQLADDMGVFYMGRDPSERGNVVRNNFFHHNGGPKGASCVVYLDDGSCGTSVLGNVFYRNRGTSIWVNGGHDHLFGGNVFWESGAAIGSGWDNQRWTGFVRDPLQVLRLRKVLDVTGLPYVARYPRLRNTFNQSPDLARGNTVRSNVSVRSGEFGIGTNYVRDNLVTDEDPGFVDAEHMDFRLLPDSAVAQVPGFRPIPFEHIGLQKDEYRSVVPQRTVSSAPPRPPRDPRTRRFSTSFATLRANGELPGQGGWEAFGPGPLVALGSGTTANGRRSRTVAVASGRDCWASISHGVILDPANDIVLQMEARLPDPPVEGSFFELYLNQNHRHAEHAFGVSLQGGAEVAGSEDAVVVRQDSAGARTPCTERLAPGHWYRLQLVIAAGQKTGRVLLRDLTASDRELRELHFADDATQPVLARKGTWAPDLPSLDALVLRLGGGAQVANIALGNGG